jgi:cytidylate kinase
VFVTRVRSIDQLVEHQVRHWQLEARRQRLRQRRPCVAVSRLPGSGADEFGRLLAERLGYAFFGIEIVDRIARLSGIQQELVAGMDERVRGAIEAVIDGLRNRPAPFSEGEYVGRLVRVIATLGEGGSAVIVGRGSAHVLGPEHALRVLVVAPCEERVERLAKRYDLPLAEARSRLEREDAGRRLFVERSFRVDPDDASLYDLALNTGSLGIDGAVDLVEEVIARRWPET